MVQAAGRVIRTEQDQGVVFLIDDRYRRAAVRALLPAWWALDGHRRASPAVNAGPQNKAARRPLGGQGTTEGGALKTAISSAR